MSEWSLLITQVIDLLYVREPYRPWLKYILFMTALSLCCTKVEAVSLSCEEQSD